ncbi:MAG: NADH-quinone oxidoreductase subunit N [Planctomycetales bacterium]|nr:NADH-quinone oxidoreductase subunit N [Planctomycetales bacterium]
MFVESKTISLLAPEIILMMGATILFMLGAFRAGPAQLIATLIAYAGAAVALACYGSPWNAESTFSGPLVIDPMSLGLRWIALLAGLIFTLAGTRRDAELAGEFQGTLMLVICGAMLASSANELVLLFLGLELISVPTYVLLFLGRRDRASAEATMKYFYLSLLASALLLYGFAFLYGISGTTVIVGSGEIRGIREAFLNQGGTGSALTASASSLFKLSPVALVLITAGFGFKLAAAPFQFYAPDVYQGTTNANAGVLAVIPKLAGVAGLLRLALLVIPGTEVAEKAFAWQLPLVLAVLTMTIGNICALWQKDIRRLLAYSSIAHGGYLLIGLAVSAANLSSESHQAAGGAGAMLFYVLVYALATMGSFCTLAYLGSPRRELSGVEELAGLARNQPLAAAALAIFMFSLAGIPPLAGFWGKLTLFGSTIQLAAANQTSNTSLALWFVGLAVVAALNAAIGAAYYLRVIAVMYFQAPGTPAPAAGGKLALVGGVLCALLVIGSGMFPAQIVGLSLRAEQKLVEQAPATHKVQRLTFNAKTPRR